MQDVRDDKSRRADGTPLPAPELDDESEQLVHRDVALERSRGAIRAGYPGLDDARRAELDTARRPRAIANLPAIERSRGAMRAAHPGLDEARHAELDHARRGGKPMPYLAEVERVFGRSFRHVEAHTGMADELAPHGARALTIGNRIAFADDRPSPALVTHELTHVAQNDQAGAAAAMAAGVIAPRHSAAEAEADMNAARIAEHGFAHPLPPVVATPDAHVHLAPAGHDAASASVHGNENEHAGNADLAARPSHTHGPDATHHAPSAVTLAVDEPVLGDSQPGFIDHSDGANLRTRPAELSGSETVVAAPIPPATRVFVSGCHPRTADWWYVTAFPAGAILRGYVQGFRVTTELPEPTAMLYQVRPGDTIERLAAQEFASAARDGHDLRYYENVLLFVNRQHGRAGITGSFQDPGLLGGGANNVQLVAGHRIWLVSPAYAAALESVVPSGSLTGGAVARAKHVVQHIEDLVKSITESPSHLREVAGEYAQAIRDHMAEIIGIMAGFVMAEATSAFLAAIPTGVGQIAAVAIQLGLAAFGAAGMAEAGIQALQHAQRWMTLAWSAKGSAEKIGEASREFVRLLVSLAMAALAYLGVKGNVSKAAALAGSMPSRLPAFALAGAGAADAGAGAAVATSMPGPAGPLGTAMAMSARKDGGGGSSDEDVTSENEPARESRSDEATQQEMMLADVAPTTEATLKAPASRHRAASVSQVTVAKKVNTVYEPTVDVTGDVAAIRAGKAVRSHGNYVINGRTYGVHDGTLYPISGPGCHILNRGSFQALGVFNKFGNTPEAHSILARMMNVGAAEIEAALAVWRLLQ